MSQSIINKCWCCAKEIPHDHKPFTDAEYQRLKNYIHMLSKNQSSVWKNDQFDSNFCNFDCAKNFLFSKMRH